MSKGTTRRGRPSLYRISPSSAGLKQPVSMTRITSQDVREFLFTEIDETNRTEIRRRLEEIDPEVGLGIDYLALIAVKNYLGPVIYTAEGEEFNPTPGFLGRVRGLLSDIGFSQKLDAIIRACTRDGNVYLRIERVGSKIVGAEYLPSDAITIIPDEEKWITGAVYDYQELPLISKKGIYIINERPRKRGADDNAYHIGEAVEGELALTAQDILHISMKADNHNCYDRFGRHTFSVYGVSKLDSLLFPVRSKLMAIYLYNKWIFAAMPRWFVGVDLSGIQDGNNPIYDAAAGDEEVRRVLQETFDEIGQFLYRIDEDPTSPTFKEYVPVEPDEWLIHTTGLDMQFKGGASLDIQISGHVEDMNRGIASALGVPMSLFGYESGSTYAIGKITSQFASGYGGGLLVAIEEELFGWMRQEFKVNGWPSTPEDWEHLTLDFLEEDTEKATSEANLDNLQAQHFQIISSAVLALVSGRVITPNEARAILADGLAVLSSLGPIQGGDEVVEQAVPQQLTFAPATVGGALVQRRNRSDEEKEVEKMESDTRAAVEKATKEFILGIAEKVEEGEI